MKKWSVEMTKEAEATLRLDFKAGKIAPEDVKVIKRWIADVEEQGLEYAQNRSDWRDHELEGEWKEHRAISFSSKGRLLYRIENKRIIVRVVRVTADHDYKKK